jgi:acyl-coenzyme A synthetase/AMP-(fatty) acid ligase
VPAGPEGPDLAVLDGHCRGRLSPAKVPASYEVVPALPRDESGKLRRRELPVPSAL